jgi:hypothetical protein
MTCVGDSVKLQPADFWRSFIEYGVSFGNNARIGAPITLILRMIDRNRLQEETE